MRKQRIKRLVHSVFFRLIAAIVIAGILMTLTIIAGFISLRHAVFDTFQQNLSLYVRYLIEDIGDPPDPARARAIAARSRMVIQYRSPQHQWIAPPGARIPDAGDNRRTHQMGPNVNIGGGRQGHFISVRHSDGWLTFWRPRDEDFERRHAWVFGVVCMLLLVILACAYFYIRRVMQPVRWLTAAMDQYGRGRLEYRMPLKRSDEFQDLAESLNRMAERIQKLLASKEKLLLDVSHELRSPIARLKVGIEMLDNDADKASLREDLVEMEAMVTEILEAARLRQSTAGLNLQKVESQKFIRAIVAEYNEPAIRPGRIDSCDLSIDPQKMRTVIKNIIDNAVKYSGESRQPVEVTARKDKDLFQITVADHGIGIPAEHLDSVFEPFFRIDPSRSRNTGGFGLGLSLCKAIMTAHGGDIRIDSQQDKGTRVVLKFQLKEAEA